MIADDELFEHAQNFAGMPVEEIDLFNTEEPPPGAPRYKGEEPLDGTCAYRLSLSYDSDPDRHKSGCLVSLWRGLVGGARFKHRKRSGAELLGELLKRRGSEKITALVAGFGDEDISGEGASVESFLDSLIQQQARLPNLVALFTGDLIQEECEISWINQASYEKFLKVYPKLETLKIRGTNDLSFGPNLKHESLKTLIIQCGGLPKSIVAEMAAAELPRLEYLELWFGEENYGGDASIADVKPLLNGRFPRLKFLGLMNSMFTDDIAKEILASGLPQSVETLDLSLGTLSDAGAKCLLDAPDIRKLKQLVIEHHFMSKEMAARLQGLPIQVKVANPLEIDDAEIGRYVAVSE